MMWPRGLSGNFNLDALTENSSEAPAPVGFMGVCLFTGWFSPFLKSRVYSFFAKSEILLL